MSVTFKIISYQRLTPGQKETFQTNLEKFSIGRSPENDWALPDPQRFMSGKHCRIENRNGTWFVVDTSTNGVFVNGSDQRMTKNDATALKVGDQIRIGDYELELVQQDAGAAAAGLPDPFLDDDDDFFSQADTSIGAAAPEPDEDLKEVNTPLSQMDSSLLGSSVSIDDLYQLDDDEEIPEPPPSLASRGGQGSPLDHHFSAPQVETPPAPPPTSASTGTSDPAADDLLNKYAASLDEIPDNWDDDFEDMESPAATPTPAATQPPPPESEEPEVPDVLAGYGITPPSEPAAAPPRSTPDPVPEYAPPPPVQPPAKQSAPARMSQSFSADSALAAFADGADLDLGLLQVPDEDAFFKDLGELLKTMTEGLMQAIASRGQVKSEFRLEQTMIAPTENNPFKFSVSANEALMRLINRSDGAYKSGIAATAEAIDDINAHQLAVMAGTEAALKSILHRFDPEKLEKRFSKDSKSVSVLKRARYWDFYKVLYTEISEAVDDDFQQLFGAEFSNAYEQQLDRLKLSRKESSR